MLKPSVARCFNSECSAKFTRLGEGMLYFQPSRSVERGEARGVVWLCAECSRDHALRYDDDQKSFVMTPHRHRGRHIA